TLIPPDTTFSSKKPPKINKNSEASKNNSQSEESFENRGGISSSIDLENLTEQTLESDTTSPQQGGISPKTPQCPQSLPDTDLDAEISQVKSALEMVCDDDDPLFIDRLYEVFRPELLREASTRLNPERKEKLSGWVAEKKLADKLVDAITDGPAAIEQIVAEHSPELVQKAIARLEALKEWDVVEEIRDAIEAV
ncbi:hypothetical protein, partial [Microcoleus sp. herbarium2]|uniref:hypothetical protein n=1 Tax=Microcoleus sp. herbarium2 TaxID=3055433 RepID=UPI002FD2EE24